MRTLDQLRRVKMDCPDFAALYRKECHICANTVRIFEKMGRMDLSMTALAEALEVETGTIQRLCDGDDCDPGLVARICRHLGLPVPENCPRQRHTECARKL